MREMDIPRVRMLSAIAISALLGIAPDARTQSATPAPSSTNRDSLTREYRGAYQRGFEQSWFTPCDSPRDDRFWWVTLTDQALLERDSLLARITKMPTEGLAVRWRATVGPRMPAGMMGRGTRYMLVTEIIEVKPLPSEGACAARAT